MLLLKNKLLGYYARRAARKQHTTRAITGFEQAQTIGILYSDDNADKQAQVRQLVEQLAAAGKRVTVLYCETLPSKTTTTPPFPTISPQDITHWGTIKQPQAKAFVNTPFDYLYHVGTQAPPLLDYLLAYSQAKCRVGHYTAARVHLLDVMVTYHPTAPHDEMRPLIRQMLHYTKLLIPR